MSQLEQIKEVLIRDGKIDNFSTIHKKLSLRLGARIWDLKQRGWEFNRHFVGKNKNNCVYEVKKYAS